jgi:hypothetical protein
VTVTAMTFSPTASGQSTGAPLHATGAPPLAATVMLTASPEKFAVAVTRVPAMALATAVPV